MMNVILAIDIGSSSIRCTPYAFDDDYDGNLIAIFGCSSSVPRQTVQPISGKIKLHDDHVGETRPLGLLEHIVSSVESVLCGLRSSEEVQEFHIAAVGFSSFVMNLIAVDGSNGNLIGEAASISYACNSIGASAECKSLRQELGKDGLEKLYQATGTPIHSAYAIPQLRALYGLDEEHPETSLLAADHKWQTIASWCIARWTGHKYLPISYSEASWTGLLNPQHCVYEESALQLLPTACRKALPALADFTDCIEGIPETNTDGAPNPYWSLFPELRYSRLYLGLGDGACANIGSKCTTTSRIAVTIGTSAAARMCLRHESGSSASCFDIPRLQGLFCYRLDRSHVLVGGALTDGGSVVEWASQFLNLNTEEAFLRCVDEMQILADQDLASMGATTDRETDRPLLVAPFFSGERSTGFRDGATGAVVGLTRETTPAHFLKSCLEGVSLRLKAILDLIVLSRDESEEDTKPILVASGKALEKNDFWRQMIADCGGLSIVLDADTEEGTSRGVAKLVAVDLLSRDWRESTSEQSRFRNWVMSREEEIHPFKISHPRPNATALFSRKASQQEEFIDLLTPLYR